jgi:hypothetical protein
MAERSQAGCNRSRQITMAQMLGWSSHWPRSYRQTANQKHRGTDRFGSETGHLSSALCMSGEPSDVQSRKSLAIGVSESRVDRCL